MSTDTGSRGLHVEVERNRTWLVDARCGACAACGVGRDYWCLSAHESGPVLAEVAGVRDVTLVRRWIGALAAFAAGRHEPAATLLVLAEGSPELVAELVQLWHSGAVVVASDARDPGMRHRLSKLSGTGRAPLVLTVTDVRAAVRAVERGGRVYGPDDGMLLPSVTELVQRDVTLGSAHNIDALVAASSWSVFAERLGTLLGAPLAKGANR
jgi:hypothetical protein